MGKEAANFQDGMDAVRGDLQFIRGIEHAAVFKEGNHPARNSAHFQVG